MSGTPFPESIEISGWLFKPIFGTSAPRCEAAAHWKWGRCWLLNGVAGFIPGWCDSTSLTVNDRFVILAGWIENTNSVFEAKSTMLVDWIELLDYTKACRLQKMYPFGTNFFCLLGTPIHSRFHETLSIFVAFLFTSFFMFTVSAYCSVVTLLAFTVRLIVINNSVLRVAYLKKRKSTQGNRATLRHRNETIILVR